MSITAQQVTKMYGAQRALNEVSFSISKGEVVGFLGPNGAGKTTSLKAICTLLPLQKGEISVFGRDVMHETRDVRRRIGFHSSFGTVTLL